MKRCPRCDQTLPLDSFHANRSMRDGKQTYCRMCSNIIRREYEERNAEALALRRAERLARQVDPAQTKRCRKCDEVKPLINFYAHRNTKDRRANYCDECQKATRREWTRRNADRVRKYNAAQRKRQGAKRRHGHRRWWLSLYDLDEEGYERLLEVQDGAIGQFDEDPDALDRAATYLRASRPARAT